MPFMIERLDKHLEPEPFLRRTAAPRHCLNHPARSWPDRVYGCIFDDLHGLASRDAIGMEQIMFETDYPHSDSTFPALV